MFGVLPTQWDEWNQAVTSDALPTSFPDPICAVVCGGNNLWRGVKHPIYYGITDDGYYVIYVPVAPGWPKTGPANGMEGFDTPGLIQAIEASKGWRDYPAGESIVYEQTLDWCTFNSSEQAYWNLGVENSWGPVINVGYPATPL